MYRDGFEAALEAYEAERARVQAREAELDGERDELPAKLLARLEEQRAKLEPAEQTVEAVQASEAALVAYEGSLGNLLDLSSQIRSARARGEKVRFNAEGLPVFRSRRWLVVALVVGLAIAFGFAPQRLLAWAKESGDECVEQLERTHEGSPSSCRERLFLAWPLAVPWTHLDAWKEWRSNRDDVALLALKASFRDQDVAARDDAVAAMLASRVPSENRLAPSGAFEALAAAEKTSLTSLRAAAVVGDLAAVERHASALGGYAAGAHLARGAWLCLLGKPSPGLEAIATAERFRTLATSNARVGANLAALACGGRRDTVGFDPLHVVDYGRGALHVLLLADPAWQAGRRVAAARHGLAELVSLRQPTAAILGTKHRALTWRDALRFTPERGPLVARPWAFVTLGEPHESQMLAPAIHAQAARNLAAWAQEAPEENPACAEMHDDTSCVPHPREALERASGWAWQRAAMAHTRLGHREAARTALKEAQTPEGTQWRLAGLDILLGDHPTALAKIEAADMASLSDAEREALGVLHAYALAGMGRIVGAFAYVHGTDAVPALTAALLRRADKPFITSEPAPAADVPRTTGVVTAGDVAGWLATLDAEADERGRVRFAMLPHAFSSLETAPAIFDLVGAMADDPAFVEPWLDHVFSLWHLESSDKAWLARARAEAARWRGDDAAAKRWDQRADVLFGLLDGAAEEMLFAVAGETAL